MNGPPSDTNELDRVAVIIPALDEADNIGGVVGALLAQGVSQIYVTDNGSTDNTGEVAAAAGAVVLDEPRRGYGYACAAGSEAAIAGGAAILVYIDADQSSRPDEITALLAPLRDGADLVLGSRILGNTHGGAMAPHQRFGNVLAAALMRRLYGLTVTDLGPYRAIRAELFQELAMSEMTFGWPTEMTVKCAKKRVRIVEVPVTWQQRHSGESKVSGTIKGSILAAYYILGVTIRHARRL